MKALTGIEKLTQKCEQIQQNNLLYMDDTESGIREMNRLFKESKNDLHAVETLLDDLSTLRYYQKHLTKYPLTEATYNLINMNNALSQCSPSFVAVESFVTKKMTNKEVSFALEGVIGNVLDKIKSIFQNILNRFKKIKNAVTTFVRKATITLKNAEKRIKEMPDQEDSNKYKELTITDINSYQNIDIAFGAINKALTSHRKNLVIDGIADSSFKLPLDIIDKKILETIGYDSRLPKTKINIYSYSKQDLLKAQRILFNMILDTINELDELIGDIMEDNSEVIAELEKYEDIIAVLNRETPRIFQFVEQFDNLYGASTAACYSLTEEFLTIVNIRTN